MTEQHIIQTATLAAKLQGCTCDVDVVIEELAPMIYTGHCRHDARCQLLRERAAPWN